MKKLTQEIRSTFTSDRDIQARECAKLEYLNAVVKESLRLYPPVVTTLPRITPAGGCIIDGHFVPGNVRLLSHRLQAVPNAS